MSVMSTGSRTPQRRSAARLRDGFGRPFRAESGMKRPGRLSAPPAVHSIVEAFDRAVECFDRSSYFEAHEFFEFIWRNCPADEQPFWKALTQYAAGLCHCQRGNGRGALALLARAARVLATYRSPYRGVDVQSLIVAGAQVAAEIENRGASPELAFPSFPLA